MRKHKDYDAIADLEEGAQSDTDVGESYDEMAVDEEEAAPECF